MADERRDGPRSTRGEELGGIIGCLALAAAIALFLWLALGTGCSHLGPRAG